MPAAISLDAITHRVREITAEQLGLRFDQVPPEARLVEDLHCDSLDMVELVMEVEEEFGIAIPDESDDPIYKALFTRRSFRVRDLGELVFYQLQVRATTERIAWLTDNTAAAGACGPFTQCEDSFVDDALAPLLQPMGTRVTGHALFRRRTDGMRCILIPSAACEIGHDARLGDERPAHRVEISSFVIDCEPVSVLAYCRFLNAINEREERVLCDLFLPGDDDHRAVHVPIICEDGRWRPRTNEAGAWPMMMVSWFGANAYSRWANRLDWRDYAHVHQFAPGRCTLPTEAQWEYAARGAVYREYPWGDAAPTSALAQFGLHRRKWAYDFEELPLAAVNAALGVSPFGLLHMAGNIWQWCADAYDSEFYSSAHARRRDPFNDNDSGIRSERGGSWIGSGAMLRSSFRRGREPHARGRCLGFRCTSEVPTHE